MFSPGRTRQDRKWTVPQVDFTWLEAEMIVWNDSGALWMHRGKSFHLVLVYSLRASSCLCNCFFLCLQFAYLNGNNDTLDLCCVYLISWLGGERGSGHSLLAQLLTWLFVYTHKVHWPLIWLYHAINKLFHLREKMFIRWKSIEERLLLLFFGCVSGGIVARLLVSAREREILLRDQSWQWERRAREARCCCWSVFSTLVSWSCPTC